jgi:hypothetical protein
MPVEPQTPGLYWYCIVSYRIVLLMAVPLSATECAGVSGGTYATLRYVHVGYGQ